MMSGPTIEIRPSSRHNRGVFARRAFRSGDLIETCPVIVVPITQRKHLDQTELYDYYFDWGEGDAALALGFGSLYNHSSDPSASYDKNTITETISIVATRDILVDEEITVSYGETWFDPVID